jgi:hypothetical protein
VEGGADGKGGHRLLQRDPGKGVEKKIRDLEQLIGKKEVEIALLKNFLGQGR